MNTVNSRPHDSGRYSGPAIALHWLIAVLNYTLLALVIMHVLAALKHQFVDRDGLLVG